MQDLGRGAELDRTLASERCFGGRGAGAPDGGSCLAPYRQELL